MKVPKTYMKKFDIIEGECTATVKVMQTVDDRFFINDDTPRYLIPLLAFDIENEDSIDAIIEDTDEYGKFDIDLLYPFLFTGVLWYDKVLTKMDLPVKGEKVIATFEYGDLDELMCTGIVTLGKLKPKKYKMK